MGLSKEPAWGQLRGQSWAAHLCSVRKTSRRRPGRSPELGEVRLERGGFRQHESMRLEALTEDPTWVEKREV